MIVSHADQFQCTRDSVGWRPILYCIGLFCFPSITIIGSWLGSYTNLSVYLAKSPSNTKIALAGSQLTGCWSKVIWFHERSVIQCTLDDIDYLQQNLCDFLVCAPTFSKCNDSVPCRPGLRYKRFCWVQTYPLMNWIIIF